MGFLERLTDTCWFNKPTMLAIIQPVGIREYFVINQDGTTVFGPNVFGACVMYIKGKAIEQGIFYSMDDYLDNKNEEL